jgi:quinoprotein glucose dehydrogenase
VPLGSPSFGGALTTAGGLVFIAAARATTLRAFDVETGTTLWAGDLPASAPATPMKYRSASGKQFIEIAVGGHSAVETKRGDWVVRLDAALSACPVARCILEPAPQ